MAKAKSTQSTPIDENLTNVDWNVQGDSEGETDLSQDNVTSQTVHDQGGSDNAPLKVSEHPGPDAGVVAESMESIGEAEFQLKIMDEFTFVRGEGSAVIVTNLGGGNAFVLQKGERLNYSVEQRLSDGESKTYDAEVLYFISDARPKLKVTTLA